MYLSMLQSGKWWLEQALPPLFSERGSDVPFMMENDLHTGICPVPVTRRVYQSAQRQFHIQVKLWVRRMWVGDS